MKLMHSCASKLSKIICLMLLGNVMIGMNMNETELKHLNVTLVIDPELN